MNELRQNRAVVSI